MTEDERKQAQEKYVDARISGKSADTAKVIAGYSVKTPTTQIERLGGPVHTLMVQRLAENGVTEDSIAKAYKVGIEAALQDGAKEKDLNALAQMLKNVGYLMGYAKQSPAVAVQINNGVPEGDDLGAAKKLLGEVKELIQDFESELHSRRPAGVLQDEPGPADSAAHSGVGESASTSEAPGGGGGA